MAPGGYAQILSGPSRFGFSPSDLMSLVLPFEKPFDFFNHPFVRKAIQGAVENAFKGRIALRATLQTADWSAM